jgi:aspartate carbamoyltransferase catalytic subunit
LKMAIKSHHLISIKDLSRKEIDLLLGTAESFKEVGTRSIKKVPTLRGKTVVTFFFEASTRTRTSFEIAAKRLSADVVNISSSTSSMAKGESLLDAARNIEAMQADVLILRHPSSGAPALVAGAVETSVINAGDGAHEHPTQALLDLLTIREKKKVLEGLVVAMVGDVAHSRVARSNILALTMMGAAVRVVGPPTLIPRDITAWTGKEFGPVEVFYRMDDALSGADVIMMLRIQTERQDRGLFPSLREYAKLYGLSEDRVKKAKKDVLVMHPGPINRGLEISPEVADGLSSGILDQAANGVAVRMAVLYHLVGASKDEVDH